MSQSFKQALVLLGGLALVVVALVWFWHSFEKVRDEVWTGFHGEARFNHYLAAERLLARLGLKTRKVENLYALDELPSPTGTLFVPVWRATMGGERSQGLRAWAESGGHLVVVGRLGHERDAARRKDELLDSLGVEVMVPPEPKEEDTHPAAEKEAGAEADDEEDEGAQFDLDDEAAEAGDGEPPPWDAAEPATGEDETTAPARAPPPEQQTPEKETPQQRRQRRSREQLDTLLDTILRIEREAEPAPVPIPGRAEPLQVTSEVGEAEWELKDASGKAVWAVPGAREYRIIQYEVGRGLITVLHGASFMRNQHIGAHDNAELVWRLATWGGRRGESWIVFGYDVPSLLDRIVDTGWMVLIALALWLATWLTRHAQRFGPLHPLPTPPRRSVLEHIDATGRFLWRHGHSRQLVDNLRDALLRRAALRSPEWSRLDERARIERVAELATLEVAAVQAALAPRTPTNRTQLIENVSHLERILRAL